MTIDLNKLKDKFFNDPDWVMMEELIRSYIEPLQNMKDIDVSQPAEHVKAEIIGRNHAYDALNNFMNDTRILKSKGRVLKEEELNPFH